MRTITIIDSFGVESGTFQLVPESKFYPYFEENKVSSVFIESMAIENSKERDFLFEETKWIRERHLDEISFGGPTTLNYLEYEVYLNFWKSLRNLGNTHPLNVVFPELPNPDSPLSSTAERQYNQRIFGNRLAPILVDKVGDRNLTLIASGTTVNIPALMTALESIEKYLKAGAIGTAKNVLLYYKPSYVPYDDILQYGINEITNYITSMGY